MKRLLLFAGLLLLFVACSNDNEAPQVPPVQVQATTPAPTPALAAPPTTPTVAPSPTVEPEDLCQPPTDERRDIQFSANSWIELGNYSISNSAGWQYRFELSGEEVQITAAGEGGSDQSWSLQLPPNQLAEVPIEMTGELDGIPTLFILTGIHVYRCEDKFYINDEHLFEVIMIVDIEEFVPAPEPQPQHDA